MAQKSQPTKIVKAPANALTDKALLEEMERDAGKGQAKHAEDKILPFMRVLQPLSPQCIKKGPAYISGAEPGDFFLSSSAAPIISGTDGLIFQPCFYRRDWIEWVPREDGGDLLDATNTTMLIASARDYRETQRAMKMASHGAVQMEMI